MNHFQRQMAYRLACWIESASARLCGRLYALSERKRRPRPLVFPSKIMVDLQDVTRRAMQRAVVDAITKPSPLLSVVTRTKRVAR